MSSAPEAIKFIQKKHSVDYGHNSKRVRGGVGQESGSSRDELRPRFFLDFLAILGKPGEAISKITDSHPLSSVSISFKEWDAPYSGKHLRGALSFPLAGRTFKIGTDALAMTWFIVFAPDPRGAALNDPEEGQSGSGPNLRRMNRGLAPDGEAKKKDTAIARDRAESFVTYFHQCVSSTILGRGIEESWRLWSHERAQISLSDWAALQDALLAGWGEFVEENSRRDRFWVGTQLAFHAYGYGGNVKIHISDSPPIPRLETARQDSEDSEDNEDSEGNPDSEDSGADDENQDSSDSSNGDDDSESVDLGLRKANSAADGPPRGRINTEEAEDEVPRNVAEAFDGGAARLTEFAADAPSLRQLGSTIEAIFDLAAVDSIAYALAADINYASNGEPRCLLADFKEVDCQYTYQRRANLTRYSLGFHPRYGNFTSSTPPGFIEEAMEPVCRNMSVENDNADVVTAGYFQGYSNIKKTVRFNPQDLLASQAIATAALALPVLVRVSPQPPERSGISYSASSGARAHRSSGSTRSRSPGRRAASRNA